MIHTKASKRKIAFAKKMRRQPTKAERAFSDIIRAIEAQLGVKFWRQTVLLGWIVDAWCPSKKIIVEIDGSVHDSKSAKKYDARRTRVLQEELGARVVRFRNEEVLRSPLLVQARLRGLIVA
jgi:leucyl-tRNA synthetase